MKKFLYDSYNKATNIKEVKHQLLLLDEELYGTTLHNLTAFNHTYFIITRNVYDKIGTGYFDDDIFMDTLDTTFGNYYFNALYNFVTKNDCSLAWKILFEKCTENSVFQFIYMALGVNAHVNNDLPQSLNDVMKNGQSDNDYLQINQVIKYSIHEVIHSLDEKNRMLQSTKNIFEPFYGNYLYHLIRSWRQNAWLKYTQLQSTAITKSAIEAEAYDKACYISSIKNVLDIPKIFFIS